jgi:hypothetical protein
MALSAHTIPTIVGSAILESLQKNLVYSRLFNTDYIGDVVPGNAVKIPSIGSVTVGPYTSYTDMDDVNVSDASQTMSIDQQSYFSLVIDDVDKAMSLPNVVAAYAKEAAYQMRDTIDQYLAGIAAAGTIVTSLGTSTTPLEINSSNVGSTLRLMARRLDDANVPRAGRVVVLPPWMVEDLASGLIGVDTDNSKVLANSMVARYAGFDVLMSNNVPNTAGAKWKIVAGIPDSATWALAINQTEMIRHPTLFADKMRGLAVYGAKLTRAASQVLAYCNEAAES